jgi:hypothetical protein
MTDKLIDIEQLNKKDSLNNSEMLLVIIQICLNPAKYKLSNSTTTKSFWDAVMKKEEFKKLLKIFKSETLRKYWRILREINDMDQLIKIIKDNKEVINNPCFKLLPVINILLTYIKEKKYNEYSLEDYFKSINESNVKKIQNNKKQLNKNNNNLIGNKKQREQTPKKENEKKPKIQELIKDEQDSYFFEIILTLHNFFPKKKFDDVKNALYKTSGNIQNAYLYLTNEDKYENLAFVGTDDYIIKNLRDKPYYKQLIESKGEESVKEREKFLGIINE